MAGRTYDHIYVFPTAHPQLEQVGKRDFNNTPRAFLSINCAGLIPYMMLSITFTPSTCGEGDFLELQLLVLLAVNIFILCLSIYTHISAAAGGTSVDGGARYITVGHSETV